MQFAVKVFLKTLLMTTICQSLVINHQSSWQKPNIDESKNSFKISKAVPLTSAKLSSFQQSKSSEMYPVQQYHQKNRLSVIQPKIISNLKEQPVSLESETGFKTKKRQLSVNNNNNKINNMKRASPLANSKQEENSTLSYDNKLMQQSIEDDDNDDLQYTTTAATLLPSSIKLPSTKAMPSSPTTRSSHEIRYLHDIFLNYPKPHHVNFGHIELSPASFEKRFQSQKAGNRYKGEIMWLDNTGGFAQYYWDLAQGRL